MGISVRCIDDFVEGILSRETDPINQARVKILVYIICAYILFTGVLIVSYTLGDQPLQLLRVILVFFSCFTFLGILRLTNAWRLVSHISICIITLCVMSNLFVYVKGINIATLQYVWFACALAFYMHGLKWGWFYSILNVLPLIIYTATDANYYFFSADPYKINIYAYLFVICFDFAVILFLHYYFFKAFHRNFVSLTKAKNELRRVSNARMDFLSTMSHELRTPMNGVIGIANALLAQNPREDQQENMAILKFSAENLLSLINDILDFSKLDSNKTELEHVPFDLKVLIEHNFASLEPKAREKQLPFQYKIDEALKDKMLVSDPTRLTQVLSNLLNNAIKFTDRGNVSLTVEVLNQDEDQMNVRFIVADTGIGIERHRQTDVFDAYTQASSSTTRTYGGTGLGLPIVKKILEIFGTDIQMESEINLGTKISFDILFQHKPAEMRVQTEAVKSTQSLDHLRVLVAEDNHVNILVIKKTLERWGIIPTIAENGLKALEKVESHDFDVILMDLHMPAMDGYETAVAVRNLKDTEKSSIPIIAFTATMDHNITKKVKDVGMNDYLPKPFKPEHLFEKLQRLQAI